MYFQTFYELIVITSYKYILGERHRIPFMSNPWFWWWLGTSINKPLPELRSTHISVGIWCHWATMSFSCGLIQSCMPCACMCICIRMYVFVYIRVMSGWSDETYPHACITCHRSCSPEPVYMVSRPHCSLVWNNVSLFSLTFNSFLIFLSFHRLQNNIWNEVHIITYVFIHLNCVTWSCRLLTPQPPY